MKKKEKNRREIKELLNLKEENEQQKMVGWLGLKFRTGFGKN